MKQLHWLIAGAVVAAAVLVVLQSASPALGRRAAAFDIVGMLRTIHEANGDIGAVNAGILTSLSGVERQAEATERVYGRLGRIADLLADQQASLARLSYATGEQAALSQELERLTAAVTPGTASMARSAGGQASAALGMDETTRALAKRLRAIGGINTATAAKLARAEELSATILDRMP